MVMFQVLDALIVECPECLRKFCLSGTDTLLKVWSCTCKAVNVTDQTTLRKEYIISHEVIEVK